MENIVVRGEHTHLSKNVRLNNMTNRDKVEENARKSRWKTWIKDILQ
jgi:hypothetical protein